jgi:hypothetical protein
MNGRRYRLWLLGVIVLSLWVSKPILAISPAFIMVYGDQLKDPIVISPDMNNLGATTMFWWRAGRFDVPHTLKGNPLLTSLSNRPYLKLAIFWGPYLADQLKPDNASQHGRLYLPSGSELAAIVVTAPDMRPVAHPIPSALEDFIAGWTLNAEDLATARRFQIPGL